MKTMVSILLCLLFSAPLLGSDYTDYIKQNEGLRLSAYVDKHGYTSIGYGRNLSTTGISEDLAELMLREDILECKEKLFEHYPWHVHQPNKVKVVLIDMCYNLGFNGLTKFKKMLASLYKKEYDVAYRELLDSKYALHVPNRARKNATLILEAKGVNNGIQSSG